MKLIWAAMWLIAAAMYAVGARGQVAGAAASGAAAQAGTGTKVYTNAELHLTFTYPAELGLVDAAAVAAVARGMVYGDDASKDECTKVLLAVGEGSGRGQGGVQSGWARVGVVEVNPQCFPAKVLREKKTTDRLLRNFVTQATTVMGTMPLEQAAGYEIEGRRACFAAAQGTPVTAGDVQTAGEELLGVAAVATEGQLVAWVIETNDQALFNRLLGSGVDFGTGKTERLLPAQVR